MMYVPSSASEITSLGLQRDYPWPRGHSMSVRWSNDIQIVRYLKSIIWGHERAYRHPGNRFGSFRNIQNSEGMRTVIARREALEQSIAYWQ